MRGRCAIRIRCSHSDQAPLAKNCAASVCQLQPHGPVRRNRDDGKKTRPHLYLLLLARLARRLFPLACERLPPVDQLLRSGRLFGQAHLHRLVQAAGLAAEQRRLELRCVALLLGRAPCRSRAARLWVWWRRTRERGSVSGFSSPAPVRPGGRMCLPDYLPWTVPSSAPPVERSNVKKVLEMKGRKRVARKQTSAGREGGGREKSGGEGEIQSRE